MLNSTYKETVINKSFLVLAVSSLDSVIRIYNTDEGNKVSEIVCKPSNN